MLSAAADLLGVEEKSVILLACVWMFGDDPPLLPSFDSDFIWDTYQATGELPCFVQKYCFIKTGESHDQSEHSRESQ